MAEENTIKTKRDLALERFQQRYPDREFADDEAMWGQVNDDYADYDNQINGYRERESQMANMFAADPRSARFLMDWKNGGDPVIMLVRQFGTDIKEALEDPEKLDAIAEVYEDWQEETGVKIFAISIDQAQNINKVKPLVNNHGWEYDVLLDPNGDLKRALGIQMIPFVLICDGKGKIVYKHSGYTDGAETELIDKVRELIK